MTPESRTRLDRDRYFMGLRWPCGRGPTAAGITWELSWCWTATWCPRVTTAPLGHGELRRRRLRPVREPGEVRVGQGLRPVHLRPRGAERPLSAARFGIPVQGAVLYTTMRPCFGCTKELLQAKVKAVFYMHDWKHPDTDVWHEYEKLQQRFRAHPQAGSGRSDKEWAVGTKPKPPRRAATRFRGTKPLSKNKLTGEIPKRHKEP